MRLLKDYPGMRLLNNRDTHVSQQFHSVFDLAHSPSPVEGVHGDGLGGVDPAPVNEVLQPIEIQRLVLDLEPVERNTENDSTGQVKRNIKLISGTEGREKASTKLASNPGLPRPDFFISLPWIFQPWRKNPRRRDKIWVRKAWVSRLVLNIVIAGVLFKVSVNWG